MQKHPRQIRPRQLAPPGFVSTLLCLGLVGLVAPWARPWLAALAVVYGVAATVASLALAARARTWMSLALLPLAYGILHVSYGLGVLGGMMRAVSRPRRRAIGA